MRTTPKTIITALIAASAIVITVPEAAAQKKGKPARGNAKADRALAVEGRDGFDARALGSVKGQFEAWKRSVLGGDDFYTAEDRELRGTHTMIYARLRTATIEDRLTDLQMRDLVDRLLAIGEEAKELRGDAPALSEGDKSRVSGQLRDLTAEAQEIGANEVERKAITPKVNRMQVSVEEVFRFGAQDDLLSKGQQESLRRKYTSLEEQEAVAKADKEVSDRERENLWEQAVENARDTAELLRR